MSSSDVGRVVVTSSMPATLLRLFDNDIRLVAEEWGFIDAEVDPGVYRVEAVFSDVSESQLVMVKPGQTADPEIPVTFATCGPVERAASTRKTHSDFARRVSEAISGADEASAGLVLMLRNLGDGPKLRVDTVDLLNHQMERVDGWPLDWILADADIVAKWATLEPGPYVLRTSRVRRGSEDIRYQTIWLSAAWQTLVFLENQSTGIDPCSVSVQMARLNDVWQPDAEESLILEATLAALRSGIPYIPPNTISRLLNGTFENPMLGIAAGHAYLLGPPNLENDSLVRIVRDLLDRVPGHPDAIALASAVGIDGLDISVTWPPMFYRSYRDLLLPADADGEGVIPEDSPAERVAPSLIGPGPWLQWNEREALLSATARTIPVTAWTGLRWEDWYDGYRDEVPGRSYHLVDKGLYEVASFQRVERTQLIESLGLAEIARILELPKSLVRSTLMGLGLPTGEPVFA